MNEWIPSFFLSFFLSLFIVLNPPFVFTRGWDRSQFGSHIRDLGIESTVIICMIAYFIHKVYLQQKRSQHWKAVNVTKTSDKQKHTIKKAKQKKSNRSWTSRNAISTYHSFDIKETQWFPVLRIGEHAFTIRAKSLICTSPTFLSV